MGGERGDGNVGGAGAARGGVREESGGRGAIGMRGARLKLKRLKLMTCSRWHQKVQSPSWLKNLF